MINHRYMLRIPLSVNFYFYLSLKLSNSSMKEFLEPYYTLVARWEREKIRRSFLYSGKRSAESS